MSRDSYPVPAVAGEPGAASRLLFLFLDGVGLGADDPQVNPLAAARLNTFERLGGGPLTASLREQAEPGRVVRRLDAGLGVAGLPQSATGQTALLTGHNAALLMGRHYGPWPGPTLKRALDAGTLFSEVLGAGGRARLSNVYPPGYFGAIASGQRRANVPVYAALGAGLPLLTLEDYEGGAGVSVDLTGAYLGRLLPELRGWTPQEQGARLARQAATQTFTFFDFWPSDDAGHRGDFGGALRLLDALDGLLEGVLAELGDTTLVIVSDHGNLEDKTRRSHTSAPVPLLVTGPQAGAFADARTLLDVAPAVRRALGLAHG